MSISVVSKLRVERTHSEQETGKGK